MISKIIPILLIVVGLTSLGLGLPDFGGDVGIPMTFSGIIGILSGIGFWRIQSKDSYQNVLHNLVDDQME
tara:strand:- start:12534 stop:12743 length:210 start_codon:yes stop_codon:yes gene_type:complete